MLSRISKTKNWTRSLTLRLFRHRVTVTLSFLFGALCLVAYYLSRSRHVTTATSRNIYLQPSRHHFTIINSHIKPSPISITLQPELVSVTNPLRVTEIHTSCDHLLDRVAQFNLALNTVRLRVLKDQGSEGWRGKDTGSVSRVIWGGDDDFMQQLNNYTQVETLVLPWKGTTGRNWTSLSDYSNVLIQEYYEWVGEDSLCTWIERPGVLTHRYDVMFNRTCNRYTNKTTKPISLPPVWFNMKPVNRVEYWPNNGTHFPTHFYERTSPYVFYLHILTDAIVTEHGEIYSKDVKLAPYGCSMNIDPRIPVNSHTRPWYDEVFVITQRWGTSTFHRMVEIMPRLGGSLGFLQSNPHIPILSPEGPEGRLGELFRILGIDSARMVTEWGRANIAYVPRSSMCGHANIQESQIVSSIYNKYTVEHLGALRRNKLVLIRRSGSRRFTQQVEIEGVLKKAAKEYGLEYTMYIDNPSPSLSDTMRIFHAARMVVGPHGAGLGNVLFSQPGTYVIEGVCNRPHVNLCFLRTAVVLGQHWHGLVSKGGCERVVDVAASDIDKTARVYLKQMFNGR